MSTEKQRLAIFMPSFAGGGAERSMVILARGMAERGYSVDLVVARREGPFERDVDPRVRIIGLNASRVIRSIRSLRHYLRAERPDALLSTLDYANVVALWARRLAHVPIRTAVLEQNTTSVSTRRSSQLRQRLMPRLVRCFYPWADHVIGNSRGVADDTANIMRVSPGKIHVIYNPVVTPELAENAKVLPAHPWFTAGQPPIVLAVGRLTQQKDFATLIAAFADVLKHRVARLMILGEGPDRPELEAEIRRLNLNADVALPGFVENPYAYMAHASLFVLSSRWEGLPTVLIEALSCGTRVVATDCPSGPREILSGGKYGTLVPVGSKSVLAEAIIAALDGITPGACSASTEPYELDKVIDQYARLLFDPEAGAETLKALA